MSLRSTARNLFIKNKKKHLDLEPFLEKHSSCFPLLFDELNALIEKIPMIVFKSKDIFKKKKERENPFICSSVTGCKAIKLQKNSENNYLVH